MSVYSQEFLIDYLLAFISYNYSDVMQCLTNQSEGKFASWTFKVTIKKKQTSEINSDYTSIPF